MSLDESVRLNQDEANTQKESNEVNIKRKVKRVDYVLKLTSNEIERKNPAQSPGLTNLHGKHEIRYKTNSKFDGKNKEKVTLKMEKPLNFVPKSDKYFKFRNEENKGKQLNNKDIYGTINKHMMKTQRYERSKYSPEK